VFRAANVIIGPHGSGLGGNLVWTNPFASSCKERTQLLEFIPGQESAQVQSLYVTYVSITTDDCHMIMFSTHHDRLPTPLTHFHLNWFRQFPNYRKWPLDYHSISVHCEFHGSDYVHQSAGSWRRVGCHVGQRCKRYTITGRMTWKCW
jgi:hypothetical protein